MMPICSVLGCPARSNDSKKKKGKTFHRFPLDPIKRKMWENAVKRKNWSPHQHSFLCSDHFEEACFSRNPTRLKEDAVPTIFKRLRKWKTPISRDAPNSSWSFSDEEFLENNTQPECPNLELLSKVCTLVQPLDLDIRQRKPNSEVQKMMNLLKCRISTLELKLEAYERKLRRYKTRVKKLESHRINSKRENTKFMKLKNC